MAMDKPEPKEVSTGVEYSGGEPKRFEVEVRHFVDDWFNTVFEFRCSGGVASLRAVEHQSQKYYLKQNRTAREKAREVAESLPFVESVVMFEEGN